MKKNEKKIDLSVVIPVYNEEENVGILQQRIRAVLDDIGKEYEIIFVDDGSTKSTKVTMWWPAGARIERIK